MAREAMTDLLKFVFNLLLHYPKVCRPHFSVPCLILMHCQLVDSDSSKGKNAASSSSQSEPKQLGEAWHPRLDE